MQLHFSQKVKTHKRPYSLGFHSISGDITAEQKRRTGGKWKVFVLEY